MSENFFQSGGGGGAAPAGTGYVKVLAGSFTTTQSPPIPQTDGGLGADISASTGYVKTAAGVASVQAVPIPIADGGTNAITANAALNNLLPSQASASGKVPMSDGTDAAWRVFDSAFFNSNYTITATPAASALTIALKTKAGADAASSDPIRIAFRNATLATGDYVIRSVTGALSFVFSSGSTAGQTSGQPSIIFVYAIDNAGTVELAASHSYFPENSRVTTVAEGGAGGADSATAIYSTTARTDVACRLIGTILNTQATAGTWASTATQIQLYPCDDIKTPTRQVFTSGSGTYNTPAGVKWIRVRMVGGGGKGAGSASSADNATDGNSGNDTTFGSSLLTASGGAGGQKSAGAISAGGSGTINSPAIGFVVIGGSGGGAGVGATATMGGMGGSSAFGGAGGGGANTAGSAGAANTGGGGGGGGNPGTAGSRYGGGGGGGGYVEAIIFNPLSSYAYVVAAAQSTNGAAGTSGSAGGNGASGVIIVEEYYQ